MAAKEPDSYIIGNMFEKYVIDKIFHKRDYTIIRMTPSPDVLKHRPIEDSKNPDFEIKRKSDGYTFSVECKYRNKWRNDQNIECAKEKNMEIYRQYMKEKGHDVYIMVGIGGKPSGPEEIFLMPLEKIEGNIISKKDKQKYGVVIRQPINECIEGLYHDRLLAYIDQLNDEYERYQNGKKAYMSKEMIQKYSVFENHLFDSMRKKYAILLKAFNKN